MPDTTAYAIPRPQGAPEADACSKRFSKPDISLTGRAGKLLARSCGVWSRFGEKAWKQDLQRVHREPQGHRALRRVRCEQACGNHIIEHTPRGALRQACDARDLPTLELTADERFFEEPDGFRLELLAAFHVIPKPPQQGVEFEKARHKLHLVQRIFEKPENEFAERALGEIAATVKVAL